jgi:hypothetical protein
MHQTLQATRKLKKNENKELYKHTYQVNISAKDSAILGMSKFASIFS